MVKATHVAVAVVSVLGTVLLVGWCARPDPSLLRASAARSLGSISVTNQEGATLRDCNLRVTDSSGTHWIAALEPDIPPSATVAVAWRDFRSNDQPMPAHLGRERAVILTCDVMPAGERKSVGFGR